MTGFMWVRCFAARQALRGRLGSLALSEEEAALSMRFGFLELAWLCARPNRIRTSPSLGLNDAGNRRANDLDFDVLGDAQLELGVGLRAPDFEYPDCRTLSTAEFAMG